jgi:uncharacterized protein (DUF924 family)
VSQQQQKQLRMMWYYYQCFMEDVEDQKRGVVVILNISRSPPLLKNENRKLDQIIGRMHIESFPHRIAVMVRNCYGCYGFCYVGDTSFLNHMYLIKHIR